MSWSSMQHNLSNQNRQTPWTHIINKSVAFTMLTSLLINSYTTLCFSDIHLSFTINLNIVCPIQYQFIILDVPSVNEGELKLLSKLFPTTATFTKDVLPTKDKNVSVKVELQIALRQIMDVVSGTPSYSFRTCKPPAE